MDGTKASVPLLALAVVLQSAKPTFEATTSYTSVKVEGFTLKISALAKRAPKDEFEPAMALLRLRLNEIVRIVPGESVRTLRSIPIWIERNDPQVPCMCYHPDKKWLVEHGMNPAKEKGVELSNLKNFVAWSVDQPMMVLHEMAHGYHDARFKFGDSVVTKAYHHAMDSYLYDKVFYFHGQEKKAYAATDPMEYFAELSEALFGYNDFYPFTRPELSQHDPDGYQMICEAWGLKP